MLTEMGPILNVSDASVSNFTGTNLCDTFGETFQIHGSSTIDSNKRFVEFSYGLAIVLAVLNVVMPVLAFAGNTTVMLTVVVFRELRVPANLFIVSLAATDLLAGVTVQPSYAFSLIRGILKINQCTTDTRVIMEILGGINITTSLGSLCLVTVDRYIAIEYPLRYYTIVTPTRTYSAIAFAWVFGCLLAVGTRLSSPFTVEVQAVWWIFVISACALMVSIHLKLYIVSRQHLIKIHTELSRLQPETMNKRDKRALKTVIIIFSTLIICYLPYVILAIESKVTAGHASRDSSLRRAIIFPVAATLLLMNSCLNPVVYFLRSRKLRTYARKLYSKVTSRVKRLLESS